ncbi:MAG TPA: LuxR C-terminal-related transcriptional regulator [Acidimicrobiia bacterium]|nr:LuxR C-terminal-related transcriptional regulator [Acidimicrobiia bacterium]
MSRGLRNGSYPIPGDVGLCWAVGHQYRISGEHRQEGPTNREIADTLFLSTKTVEPHIRNIFNTRSPITR